MCLPERVASIEARKRIAVPAAFTLITGGMSRNASATTLLSSQSEILLIGTVLPLKARITNALLLILLLAGKKTSVCKKSGAYITICGAFYLFF
jgi:hypothetical protein